jgi:hypothetical protein
MINDQEMQNIVAEVSKALCGGHVRNSSLFVRTGAAYPNGVGAITRIDRDRNGFIVSDDGYASTIAETMKAVPAFNKIASGVAARSGVLFEKGTLLLTDIERGALPVAVSLIANSSCRAIERLVASLEQPRIRRARDLFDKRLRAAFGDKIKFDIEHQGATGHDWRFDAGLERGGLIVRLFELVSPTTQSVALANLKIVDTVGLPDGPKVTAALADYDGTDPALRSILSNSGGTVIAANDDIASYRLNAA